MPSPSYASLSSLLVEPSTYVPLWYPYIYFACNIFSFLRMHNVAWLLFSFRLIASLAIRERGHPLSRDLFNSVGLVTLVLKRFSPRLQAAYPVAFDPPFSPSPPRPDHPAVIVR
ncbi:hypothetical protein K523DRAFT_359115 [Schizophyllum commune Tattone D]|nr:hypothetical protein K523DRAFT_359115 [Schizophyllum commune Tattone D]